MANISLQVAQDPNTAASLSLADTLAKATFGDPEAQMKAKALGAEVGVRMASRDKLLADAGLVGAKTKTEQDTEAEILNAGPAIGAAGAAAVPMPIPVEASRPNDSTGYGPQPGIVSPHDQAVHDALVARERAIGPLLARGTPDQVAKGVNENYGGTILSAAAANPAIVSGDSLRIAGGLSTGSAPTTSTVWSAGDTSGVDAAAREKILEARGTPQKPDVKEFGDKPYLINADGTIAPAQGFQPKPDKPTLVDLPGGGKGTLTLDANGNPTGVQALPGAEGRPEKQEIVDLPSGGKGAVIRDAQGNVLGTIPIPGAGPGTKLVTVGKDTAWQNPDGSLTAPVVQGRPVEEPKIFGGNSTADEALNFVTGLGVKMQDPGYKPTYQDAATYASAYNHLYEQPKPVEYKLEDGSTGIRWVTSPPPTGSLTPAQVFGRLTGQAAPPVQAPPVQAPPVQAPPVQAPPVQAPPVQASPVVAAAPPVATPPVVIAPPAAPAAPPVSGGPVGSVVTQQLSPPAPPKPATEAQSKARQFLPSLQIATQTLDKYNKSNLPGVWELGYTTPSEELGTFGKFVESSPAISDNARRFGSAANQWTSASLYDLSGAAIGKGEFDRSVRGMLPRPGDPQDVIDTKTKLRHAFLDAVANTAYANDPKVLALLAQGKSLNSDGSAAPPQNDGGAAPTNDNAPAGASQGVKDAWSHLSAEAKDRARKRYGQ